MLAILGGLAILLVLGLVTLRSERRNIRYRIGLFFDREVGEPPKEGRDARKASEELGSIRGAQEAGKVEGVRGADHERGGEEEEA